MLTIPKTGKLYLTKKQSTKSNFSRISDMTQYEPGDFEPPDQYFFYSMPIFSRKYSRGQNFVIDD